MMYDFVDGCLAPFQYFSAPDPDDDVPIRVYQLLKKKNQDSLVPCVDNPSISGLGWQLQQFEVHRDPEVPLRPGNLPMQLCVFKLRSPQQTHILDVFGDNLGGRGMFYV